MMAAAPVIAVLRRRRFRRFPGSDRRRRAGDAVCEGVHSDEKRRAEPRWQLLLRRHDVGTKRVRELQGPAAVSRGRRCGDRRSLRLPLVRQRARHPGNRGSLPTCSTTATGHEYEKNRRREEPQHRAPVPVIRPDVASHWGARFVRVLLMPMLHGCAFQGCSTFTLSTYCVEHELLVRAAKESERAHLTDASLAADTALTADATLVAAAPEAAAS